MLDNHQKNAIQSVVDSFSQHEIDIDQHRLVDQIKTQSVTLQSLDQINHISSAATTLFKECARYIVDDLLIIDPNNPPSDEALALLYSNGLIASRTLTDIALLENSKEDQSTDSSTITLPYRGYFIRTDATGRELTLSGYPLARAGKMLATIMDYHHTLSDNRALRSVNEFIQFLATLPSFSASYRFDIFQKNDDRLRYIEEVIIERY